MVLVVVVVMVVVIAPSQHFKIIMDKEPPSVKARFLASLGASFVAVTVCSPLDVAKTRFQVQMCYLASHSGRPANP